jgi:hypothetical protein
MKLTSKEKHIIVQRLDIYADTLMSIMSEDTNGEHRLYIEDLELIKSIFQKMLEEDELITGVLTKPKSQLEDAIEFATQMCKKNEPRSIWSIIEELRNHPEYLNHSLWTKEWCIENIVFEIEDQYPDDDKPGMYDIIYKDAEQIFENNKEKICENIKYWYDDAFENTDLLEDCNLTLEKQIK